MNVGTLPWLLRHELRLWWREITSRRGTVGWAIALGILILLMIIMLWIPLSFVQGNVSLNPLPLPALWIGGMFWIIGCIYGLIIAVQQTVATLFERGDLDLLVASPMSGRVIFASRLFSIALQIFLYFCPIVVPVSLLSLMVGIPQLLGLYPALMGLALFTTSLAMLLILGLVRLVGAKRAKNWIQLLALFLTAFFFVSLQLLNTGTPTPSSGTLWQTLSMPRHPLSPGSLIWFPVKAMFFDPGSVLLTLLVSGGLMGLAIATSHQAFILGTQQATITKHRPGRSQQNHRFTSGLTQVVLLKEWRIISRNPQLVLGIGFQIVILGVILLRNGLWEDIAGSGLSIAMVGIVLSESLASTFTLICVSAEEAADLLQAAPVEGMEFRRLKLLAALIPTWLLITPLFILLLWQGEPWFFPWLVALGASTCAAVLRLWNARPISLSDLFRKRQTAFNDLLLNIFETISLFTWAWLGFLVVKSWWFFVPLPLLVIAIVVAIAYLRSRQLGTTLGF